MEREKVRWVLRSTEKMEEEESKQEFNDTEEIVQWRSINQEEIDNVEKLSEQLRKKC